MIVLLVHILTYNNNIDNSNKLVKLLTTLVNLLITLAVSVVLTFSTQGEYILFIPPRIFIYLTVSEYYTYVFVLQIIICSVY